MNLRKKILLITLFGYVPIIVFFGIFSYIVTEQEVVTNKLDHLNTIAAFQESRINEAIDKNFERLQGVSSRTQLRLSLDNYNNNPNLDDLNKINKIISDAKYSISDFKDIQILNPDGKIVTSTKPQHEKNFLASTVFENELHSQNIEININSVDDPSILLSGPLYLDGKVIGVVVIETDLESIVGIIGDYSSLGNTGESFLAKQDDQGNAFLITPLRFDPHSLFTETYFSGEYNLPIIHALKKHEGTFTDTTDYRGESVLSATRYIEKTDWGLVVKIDTSEAFLPLENLKTIIIFGIFSLLFVATMTSFMLVSRFAKPIKQLKTAAKTISKGNYDVYISESKDELGELSREFVDMAKSLKKSRKELVDQKEIQKMKEEFLTMLSHEIKTPLTPIMMWIDTLKEPTLLGKLNADQKDALNLISNLLNQLKQLTGDMFDAYKLDLNQLQFHFQEFNVKTMMEQLYQNNEKIFFEKNIDFKNTSTGSLLINSDQGRLTQIIQNLLNNAMDFSPEIGGEVEINASDKEDYILFYVRDNGKGISEEHQKNLFKKFYQVDSSLSRKHGGTGLGLSICKSLVNGLNGKIWVKSQVGSGTTFFVEIPKNLQPNIECQDKNPQITKTASGI